MTTRRRFARAALLPSMLLLAACSTPATRVVLLPQSDGSPSGVVVNTEDGAESLSAPYQRATAALGAHGAPVVDTVDPQRVKADNAALFDLAPAPALHYTVYFDVGGTTITPASQIAMNEAMQAALSRSGGEIVITGHADAVGTSAQNDELSLNRALRVRQIFLERGFPAERTEAVGRGQRDPAVPTPAETSEARNRRVTIEVR